MKAKDFYTYAYRLFDEVTPLAVDCGKLCDAACCKGDDETGMYLFPFENIMFEPCDDNFKIEKSEFECGGRNVDILLCKPFCNRKTRPLACRIFPLVPYIYEDGSFDVVLDRRGRYMCPFATAMTKDDLDSEFVRRVTYISRIMMKIPEFREFIREQSRLIDETCFI